MRGKRGQLSPLTVRARLEGDRIVYDIIDGFHRSAALQVIAKEDGKDIFAKAVVVYGCSDEELFDLRILAVNSVKSVSFSRLVEWMQGAFSKTKWAEKGISLSQAFSLATQDSSGIHFKLSADEVGELKRWAFQKAKKWGKNPASLCTDLRMVEHADPDLIKRVRVGGGGPHAKKGEVNPACLRAIVNELPDDHRHQQMAADIVNRNGMSQKEAQEVAHYIASHTGNPGALQRFAKDPMGIIHAQDSVRTVSQHEKGPPNREGHLFIEKGPSQGTFDGHVLYDKALADKDKEITSLRQAIEAQRRIQEERVSGDPYWYETIEGLFPLERTVMEMFFSEIKDPDEIAGTLQILPHQVVALIQSGMKKYLLERQLAQLSKRAGSLPRQRK
jgi:hypothetical protein